MVGMAYPIEKGKEGYWPRRGVRALRLSSLLNILGTFKGERVMLPEFGSNLARLLFEPNDVMFRNRIQEEVVESLQRWDPNLQVVSVIPEQVGANSQITLFIDYVDRSDPLQARRSITLDLRG